MDGEKKLLLTKNEPYSMAIKIISFLTKDVVGNLCKYIVKVKNLQRLNWELLSSNFIARSWNNEVISQISCMVSSLSLKMGDFDFRKMKSLGGGENFIHHTRGKTPW